MVRKPHTWKYSRSSAIHCRDLAGDAFHPDVRNLRQEGFHGLEQGGQYLAFADVFLPKGLRQLVVLLITGGYLLDTGQFNTEIQFVDQPFLTHALRDGPVHGEAELRLDVFQLFV